MRVREDVEKNGIERVKRGRVGTVSDKEEKGRI